MRKDRYKSRKKQKREVCYYQATRSLEPHQSDRNVQSDLSYRHYMMNMVQPWHKKAFVGAWSGGHSRAQTDSQSGSKWPKGPHRKKSNQTCAAQ